jgi:hypothetical protein
MFTKNFEYNLRPLELLELDGHLSPMYVKYIFFDIVKKLQHRILEISKRGFLWGGCLLSGKE